MKTIGATTRQTSSFGCQLDQYHAHGCLLYAPNARSRDFDCIQRTYLTQVPSYLLMQQTIARRRKLFYAETEVQHTAGQKTVGLFIFNTFFRMFQGFP